MGSILNSSPVRFALSFAAMAGLTSAPHAQETPRASTAGEQAAQRFRQREVPAGYNLRARPFAFEIRTGLSLEYNDNIFHEDQFVRDDFILRPSANVRAYWPITELNALNFDLGIGYDYYFHHTSLNSDLPLISPNSALSINLFVGDFRIEFHERFSYQESLNTYSYDYQAGEVLNIDDIARFERFQNTVGTTIRWDLNEAILAFGYDHENFLPQTAAYDYLERASELFTLRADLLASPQLKPGLEIKGSLHDYANDAQGSRMGDHWRAGIGPSIDWTISQYLHFRAGAGYEAIRVDDPASQYDDEDTWYAYARLHHRMNPWFTHWLDFRHGNDPGYNALNIERTSIDYTTSWAAFRNIGLGTVLGVSLGQEGYGASKEDFTYYRAILRVSYQLGERWRSTLDYSLLNNSSDLAGRDYDQNRVTIGIEYRL